jgi:hypothetical protein
MTIRTMIVALATATSAAAASAGVWYALAPQNSAPAGATSGQSAPASAPEAAAGPMTVVVLCVTPDRVLHKPSTANTCPPGQRLISLELEEECPLCPPDRKPPADSSADPALRELEARIDALEHAPYFEVVNNNEVPVFAVSQDGVRVFNKAGVPKAKFGSAAGGGYLTVTSGFADASMSATSTAGSMQFVEDGLTRLTLSGNDSGGSSLRVPSGNGVIAGFGASKDGPGTLLLGTLDGRVKHTLSIPGDRATVQVQGDNDAAITLMEQRIGGGMLQIDSQAGAIVKMGHVDNRYGIVMTGPRPGIALIPKSGLPGSFFLGCGSSSPPACTPIVP